MVWKMKFPFMAMWLFSGASAVSFRKCSVSQQVKLVISLHILPKVWWSWDLFLFTWNHGYSTNPPLTYRGSTFDGWKLEDVSMFQVQFVCIYFEKVWCWFNKDVLQVSGQIKTYRNGPTISNLWMGSLARSPAIIKHCTWKLSCPIG